MAPDMRGNAADSIVARVTGAFMLRPFAAIALTAALAWAVHLTRSLWLDETLTVWVASGSFSDTVRRSVSFQGQSPLYFLLEWFVMRLLGRSELALRLVSILAVLAAAWFVYRIGCRLLGSRASALLAAVVFTFTDGAMAAAVNARPYGLGLLGVTSAVHALLAWREDGRLSTMLLCAFATLLAVYSSPFFGGVLLVEAAVLVVYRRELPPARSHLLAAGAVVLAGMTLLYPQLALQFARRGLILVSGAPDVLPVFIALLQPSLVLLLAVAYFYSAALLGTRLLVRPLGRQLAAPAFLWVVVWYLLPPLTQYAVALRFDAATLFKPAYLAWQAPAAALLAALCVQHLTPEAGRRAVVVIFLILSVIGAPLRQFFPEDWRGAVAALRGLGSQPKVLYYSGVIESNAPQSRSDPELRDYIAAPLTYYGYHEPVTSLPFHPFGREGEAFWQTAAAELRQWAGPLVVIGDDTLTVAGRRVSVHIAERLQSFGFELEAHADFGRVWLAQFKRS